MAWSIDILDTSNEESVSYFKRLENLEKIKLINGSNPSSLPVDNKKRASATSSVGKPSKNHQGSNMWCHYCDSTITTWLIAEQSPSVNFKNDNFEAKDGPGKKSLAFLS
jgi:hypothetical protein